MEWHGVRTYKECVTHGVNGFFEHGGSRKYTFYGGHIEKELSRLINFLIGFDKKFV